MTLEEKKQFIGELCRSIENDMYKRLGKVPEEWDGIELRMWFADMASQSVFHAAKARSAAYYAFVLKNYLV